MTTNPQQFISVQNIYWCVEPPHLITTNPEPSQFHSYRWTETIITAVQEYSGAIEGSNETLTGGLLCTFWWGDFKYLSKQLSNFSYNIMLFYIDELSTSIQNNILRMYHFIVNVDRDFRVHVLRLRTELFIFNKALIKHLVIKFLLKLQQFLQFHAWTIHK